MAGLFVLLGHIFFDRASFYSLVNKANLVHSFSSYVFFYMFRATMCLSSGEITLSMGLLVFVTLKQGDSLKLQGLKLFGTVDGCRLLQCRCICGLIVSLCMFYCARLPH